MSGSADLFVSHGHLDHSLGVPFVLSNRTLHQSSRTRVFCPEPMASSLRDLVGAAERLEDATYDWKLHGLSPGDRVEVGRDLAVEAFEVPHVVPSLGYHLRRSRRHLRPELRSLAGEEIARRRRAGEVVEETSDEIWLTYCGDSGPEVFDRVPALFSSPILMIECTFAAPGDGERAQRYGHLCFDDLVQRQRQFSNETIVLQHLSRRHRPADLRRRVDEELPELADRIRVVGVDS